MSLYRISTANTYDATIQNIAKRQMDMATSQEQLSSGKRVLKASDDAVAATLSERAQRRLARVEADQRALEAARTALTQAESELGNANDILLQVRELMVQAGNPILSASQRKDLSSQLIGLREQMLTVANATDTAGQSLFGGLGGAMQPFVDTYGVDAGVVFQGQPGQYAATETALPQAIDGNAAWMNVPQGNGTFMVKLGSANQGTMYTDLGVVSSVPPALDTAAGGEGYVITIGGTSNALTYTVQQVTGRDADGVPNAFAAAPVVVGDYVAGKAISVDTGVQITFHGTPTPADSIDIKPTQGQPGNIFKTLQNVIDALQYTGPNQAPNLTQELARGLAEVDAGTDQIFVARGRVGDWLNRADVMDARNQDRAVAYQKEDSDLTDLDMVKGITEFQSRQTALDAALKSYSSVQKLSLFQYIA